MFESRAFDLFFFFKHRPEKLDICGFAQLIYSPWVYFSLLDLAFSCIKKSYVRSAFLAYSIRLFIETVRTLSVLMCTFNYLVVVWTLFAVVTQ